MVEDIRISVAEEMVNRIKRAGPDGMSARDLKRWTRYSKLGSREKVAVDILLRDAYGILTVKSERVKRGRPSFTYLHPSFDKEYSGAPRETTMFEDIGRELVEEMGINGLDTAKWSVSMERTPRLKLTEGHSGMDRFKVMGGGHVVNVREGFDGDLSEWWQTLGEWPSDNPTLSELANLFRRVHKHAPGRSAIALGYEVHINLDGVLVDFEVVAHMDDEDEIGMPYDDVMVRFTVQDECRMKIGSSDEVRKFCVTHFGHFEIEGPRQRVEGDIVKCGKVRTLHLDDGGVLSVA